MHLFEELVAKARAYRSGGTGSGVD
jgi:hypothetical protein